RQPPVAVVSQHEVLEYSVRTREEHDILYRFVDPVFHPARQGNGFSSAGVAMRHAYRAVAVYEFAQVLLQALAGDGPLVGDPTLVSVALHVVQAYSGGHRADLGPRLMAGRAGNIPVGMRTKRRPVGESRKLREHV